MEKLKKIYNKTKFVYDFIPMICLLGILVFVLIGVISRFILHIPVPWTQEGACLFLLCLCATGLPVATRRGDNLGAFFLRDRTIGKPVNTWLYLFSSIVCCAFMVVLIIGCFRMYGKQSASMSLTTILWYQTRWNYIVMGLGCILTLLYCLRDLIWSLQMIVSGELVEDMGRSSPKKED